MNMRMLPASALCALVVAAAACSGGGDTADCTSLCMQSNMCPGATPTDCTKSCASATALNTAADCTAEYEQILSCASDQPDVCTTPESACSSQIAAYQACVETFCMKMPQPAACAAN